MYSDAVPSFETGYAVTPGGIERDYRVSSLAMNWDFGPATLSTITGYNDLDYRRAVDDDFSAPEYHYRTTQLTQEEWSQEIRLTSDADRRLRWMAGLYGYFLDDRTEVNSAFQSIYAFLGGLDSVVDQQTDELAIFGSIGYDITDALTLTFSARYQDEEKKVAAADTELTSMQVSTFEDSNSWTAFLPRLALDWRFSDMQMVYASYTRSQKSGGFNVVTRSGAILPDERTYGPETSDNYELGWKSDLAGGRVMTTMALFYIDWDDQIVRALGQTFATLNTNAGRSTSKGVELEMLARPTDRIDIRFGLAYTNAKYDEYFFGALARLGMDPVLDGLPLQFYSRWTTNIDFGYTQPVVIGDWDWFGRFDWDWRDRQNVVPTADAWVAASSRLNLRTGFGNERWTVTLWGRNILDNNTATTAVFATNPAMEAEFATNQRDGVQIFQALVTSPDPRSWGVTANFQF
jgi:iron complex outermembrane receptor protein